METTNTDWLVDPEGTQEAVGNIAARKAAGTWPTTEAQINAAIFAPTAVYEAIGDNNHVLATAETMVEAYECGLRQLCGELDRDLAEDEIATQVETYKASYGDDNIIVRPIQS